MRLYPGACLLYQSPVAPAQYPVVVRERRDLSGGYFVLELEPAADAEARKLLRSCDPGQFVMLRGEWGRDLINGRAFSVLDLDGEGSFSILAKVFGRGTELMSRMEPGDRLTATVPLGRPFPKTSEQRRQILVAGGVGLPPLHLQARRAVAAGMGAQVVMLYGGRGKDDIVMVGELEAAGIELHIATEDGSLGHAGRVTELLASQLEVGDAEVLACGPTGMLKAVREHCLPRSVPTFLCLEEQMACGFGVCLGCAVPVYGDKPYRYCCTDGPVFNAKELRW